MYCSDTVYPKGSADFLALYLWQHVNTLSAPATGVRQTSLSSAVGQRKGDIWPCYSIPTAHRSDRYGHTISCLDRLIIVKAIISLRLPFHTYLSPSVLLHPDALIPFLYYIARISRHAVIWTRLIPVILWGALIVTVMSLGFLWVFN